MATSFVWVLRHCLHLYGGTSNTRQHKSLVSLVAWSLYLLTNVSSEPGHNGYNSKGWWEVSQQEITWSTKSEGLGECHRSRNWHEIASNCNISWTCIVVVRWCCYWWWVFSKWFEMHLQERVDDLCEVPGNFEGALRNYHAEIWCARCAS